MAILNNIVNDLGTAADAVNKFASGPANLTSGFNGNSIPSADGTGLPSSKVLPAQVAEAGRDIIHWFIPEFGIVKMYVNPSSISYQDKKIITKDRTKGGYLLQYFGEELTKLNIRGTTGSSGIEGINVLYEIYRSEQLSFDAIGLSLAADNAALGATQQLVSSIGSSIGGAIGGVVGSSLGSGLANGIFGTDNFTALAPRNIASLASLALGIEMYYSGRIYRGFFESMTVEESASNMGLFEYTIEYTVTQQRGYRTNGYAWQRSANSGPSNNDSQGGIPLSFTKLG